MTWVEELEPRLAKLKLPDIRAEDLTVLRQLLIDLYRADLPCPEVGLYADGYPLILYWETENKALEVWCSAAGGFDVIYSSPMPQLENSSTFLTDGPYFRSQVHTQQSAVQIKDWINRFAIEGA